MKVENSFKEALREAVSREFSDIPFRDADIPYTFSPAFLHKMDKLTKAQKTGFWQMTSTIPKRVAVIVGILLILLSTAFSIPSARAAIKGFVIETFDTYLHLFTDSSDSSNLTELHDFYGFSELPEGFKETNRIKGGLSCTTTYHDTNGDEIILTQHASQDYSLLLDNEMGELHEIHLSGMDIWVYRGDAITIAIWLQDQYAFDLVVYGNYDLGLILSWIEKIRPE